jgi:peroxiredoxin
MPQTASVAAWTAPAGRGFFFIKFSISRSVCRIDSDSGACGLRPIAARARDRVAMVSAQTLLTVLTAALALVSALFLDPSAAHARDRAPLPAAPAPVTVAAPPVALAPWTGGQLPAFTLDDLTGDARPLESFRGRTVLVHFFATWCEPCVPELASLQRLALASRDQPLAIVAIDVGEVDLRVRAFFEKRPVDFPVLLDRDRAITKAWSITALPSTIVLDATLRPRLIVEGDLDWTRPDIVNAIATLYPQQSSDDTPAPRRLSPHTTGGHNGPT